MSGDRWEPLTTAEAVVEAVEAGRRVERRPKGFSLDWSSVKCSAVPAVACAINGGWLYRALIEPAQPAADAAPAIPPGYKPWGGGECPEDARNNPTHVFTRSGHTSEDSGPPLRGYLWCWRRDQGGSTIIAYRVSDPAAVDPSDAELADAIAVGAESWAPPEFVETARAVAPKADARTLCESCAGPTVRRTCENCGGNFWMSASKTDARAELALSLDSQREMADAWSAVFNTLTEVMPSWLRERRCARDCAVAAIREMAAGSAPAEPAEVEALADREAFEAWARQRPKPFDLEPRGDRYWWGDTDTAWRAWEAARRLRPVVVDETPIAKPLSEWHEDHGDGVWFTWRDGQWLGEPAWIGTPLDSDWPGYHTHYLPHPPFPAALTAALNPEGRSDGNN